MCRIYYQSNPKRLQTCPINVHYLLHIADSIQFQGPVWCYWAYPMERFCSFIGASVKSRRFPYTNIARRIRDTIYLRICRERYGLHDEITFGQTQASTDQTRNNELEDAEQLPDCMCHAYVYTLANIFVDPGRLLLTPHSERLFVSDQLRTKIAAHLATVYRVTTSAARKFIPSSVKQWGRMRISGGGDLIQARGYHKLRPDERDASFVRVSIWAYILLGIH